MWCFAKISPKISVTSHNLSLVSPNYICPTAPSKELGEAFIIYQPFIIPVARLLSKGGRWHTSYLSCGDISPHDRSSCGKILHDCPVEKILYKRNVKKMWRNSVYNVWCFVLLQNLFFWRFTQYCGEIFAKNWEDIAHIWHASKFSKFCPISKILTHFQNFDPFSKFCPNFKIYP